MDTWYVSYQRLHVWTRELSTVTREIDHEASRPDRHEPRISRVNRSVARRVESGQQALKCRSSGRSGRVGSIGSGRVDRVGSGRSGWVGSIGSGQEAFKSHGSGRGGSGQEVFKSHGSGGVGSGRVGSRGFRISGVGSGNVPTRPDPCICPDP